MAVVRDDERRLIPRRRTYDTSPGRPCATGIETGTQLVWSEKGISPIVDALRVPGELLSSP